MGMVFVHAYVVQMLIKVPYCTNLFNLIQIQQNHYCSLEELIYEPIQFSSLISFQKKKLYPVDII